MGRLMASEEGHHAGEEQRLALTLPNKLSGHGVPNHNYSWSILCPFNLVESEVSH